MPEQSPQEINESVDWQMCDSAELILYLNNTDLPHFDGFIDNQGRTYGRNRHGYVNFTDLSIRFLGQQSQYSSRYIDGILEEYPSLKDGLPEYAIKGSSANPHQLGIHPDFCEEMINRIIAYVMIRSHHHLRGGEEVTASSQQLRDAVKYLEERGFVIDKQDKELIELMD